MSKLIRELPMGDYVVTLHELANGDLQSKLSSASQGPLLEIHKLAENGHLRVKELELGSAYLKVEHLALLLTLIGAGDEMLEEINNLNSLSLDHDSNDSNDDITD
ncbi:hypothetical protein PU629_05150 [Pullulanibacillus sp. KACC 23026]|uniref:hypothetical protein n=1 Tax=Pullulanibacillus sp. KACC 23026 TaxID=3028315 RepID=UPI0023B19848|nr:hypothetical protein [Pullulanibacillus sp. KACC 23026]WEG13755.1 hypothetical protein PU629_05150 [Pullulanibacillus sp. KACC 23026]